MYVQSTLLLFLWEKMVYTICGGETPMKKNKSTMSYMQLSSCIWFAYFHKKNLANVKNWPKNSHFCAKNHVLWNSRENTLQKMSDNLGCYFDPKMTPNCKQQKKPIKTMCLVVKTSVLHGFLGFKPWNGVKTKKIVKTDVDVGWQKILHG